MISVIKVCNNSIWSAEVINDLPGYDTAMTSSELIQPVNWNTSRFYSVGSNQTKTFWVRKDGVITNKTEVFGFCAGIPQTTTQVSSTTSHLPYSQPFICYGKFVILPLFLEVGDDLQAIPNPIFSIEATCKCDIVSIQIVDIPTKGTLIGEKFQGNLLISNDFEDMSYYRNNLSEVGIDIIRYRLVTNCGVSPLATIEIKLI